MKNLIIKSAPAVLITAITFIISLNTVFASNFGSGAGYYFANSISSGAPSQPEFYWKDTACSHSLIVNGVITEPSIFVGTIDNGYFKLGNILKGNKIKFGGELYDSVFISTNGLIGFKANANLSSSLPVQNSAVRPAIYALWHNLNYGDPDVPINRLSYKSVNGTQLIITYDRAPIFNPASSYTEFISFQIIIKIIKDILTGNSTVTVQYADVTSGGTGTGFYDRYNNNTLGRLLIGLQYSAGNELDYRYSNGPVISVPGPVFDLSPLALEFGPDQYLLNYNGNNGLFYPQYGLATNGIAVEPVSYGSNVYQGNNDSFFVSKFDSSGMLVQSHFANLTDHPTAMACSDDGYLYVGKENGGIDKFTFTGAMVSFDFIPGVKPTCIFVNTVYDSVIYVADSVNQRISKYNSNTGQLIQMDFITGINAMALELYQNYLWVATGAQNKIKVYDRVTGIFLTESRNEDIEYTKNVTSMFISSDATLYFFSRSDSVIIVNGLPVPVVKKKLCGTIPYPTSYTQRFWEFVIFGAIVVTTLVVGAVVAENARVARDNIIENNKQLNDINPSPGGRNVRESSGIPGKVISETFITPTDCLPALSQGGLTPPAQNLDMKLFVQGFYNSSINEMVRDTVKVFLRNVFPPFAIADSSSAYINSDGTARFNFTNASDGVLYYIQIKHRNSINTWSKPGGEIFTGSHLDYDFTTSSSQAFGNNLILKGSKYCVYNGDVDRDSYINLTDVILAFNDARNFATGYKISDTNGDSTVDLNDMLIIFNNAVTFKHEIHP